MPKVHYEARDRIAYVTISRPEAKNAIDPETHELLWAAWERFRDTARQTWPSSPAPATRSAPAPT